MKHLRGVISAITMLACGGCTEPAGIGRSTQPAGVPPNPVALSIVPSGLTLIVGDEGRLTARASDAWGRTTSVSIEWSSADPAVVTVGKTDGIATAISVGSTMVTAAVGDLRAIVTVSVKPLTWVTQWANGATASTEWSPDEWSAFQATGAPDVIGCADDPGAWASLSGEGLEWLELTYAQPVQPSEIQIHEVTGVSQIVKVEVRHLSGEYETVYTAQPIQLSCPRILGIPVTGVSAMVSTVRVTVDERLGGGWNEIDAVRLDGHRGAVLSPDLVPVPER